MSWALKYLHNATKSSDQLHYQLVLLTVIIFQSLVWPACVGRYNAVKHMKIDVYIASLPKKIKTYFDMMFRAKALRQKVSR